jgi:propionyl-CoA synthetase
LIISSSYGVDGAKIIYKPLLDSAIELAADVHNIDNVIVFQRSQAITTMIPGRDSDWKEGVENVKTPVKDCVPVESDHPLYVLYTSGTTGAPKGVLRDNAGHAAFLKWTMQNVYGLNPGEIFWAAR